MTAPTPAQNVSLPTDGILLPYEGVWHGVYEHGFAAFAHGLTDTERTGEASSDLILHESVRRKRGYKFVILRSPIIAWNLTTNRTTICKALVLVEKNVSGRADVWSSDNLHLARNMFESL